MTKHLIVVGGPTASGKTAWAIRLARHFSTEILSADSRQFYRELTIGTAKPSEAELREAPHHFIGHISIDRPYSVGDFERDALQKLGELFTRHDVVVLTGGSGLYLKALCEGLDEFPEVPVQVREEVEQLYTSGGLPALQKELARVDPEYFTQVDHHNPSRLIRAIAVCRASDRKYSEFRRGSAAPRPFIPVYLQLHRDRQQLYRRIDLRVDDMIAGGLVEEARSLYPHRNVPALQTVGYQELFDFFDGKLTLSEAVALIKQNSRRYAKRQLTWMRRDGYWKHLGAADWDLSLRYIGLVRSQGLRIARLPAESLGFSLLPSAREAVAICLTRGEEPVCGLALHHFRSFYFLDTNPVSIDGNGAEALEMLLHEAVCPLEGAPVYMRANPTLEPFMRRLGFKPADSTPVHLESQAPLWEKR